MERYAANEVLPHAGMGPCVKGHGEVKVIEVLGKPVGWVFQRCVITVSTEDSCDNQFISWVCSFKLEDYSFISLFLISNWIRHLQKQQQKRKSSTPWASEFLIIFWKTFRHRKSSKYKNQSRINSSMQNTPSFSADYSKLNSIHS